MGFLGDYVVRGIEHGIFVVGLQSARGYDIRAESTAGARDEVGRRWVVGRVTRLQNRSLVVEVDCHIGGQVSHVY